MDRNGSLYLRSPHKASAGRTTAGVKDGSALARRRVRSAQTKSASKPRSASLMTADKAKPASASHVKEIENDIKFINIESPSDSDRQLRQRKTLNAQEILEKCQETDYREVYDINLRGCQLTEVPNLEKFCKVRVMDLSSNHIPSIARLECCGELRELKLYDNDLTSIEKLDALSDLNHLQLQHNKIAAVGRGLTNARKLLTLRLDWNRISRLESKEMASLSKLTTLDLSNNKLDNISALNSLPNLLELSVCNNRLKSIDLPRCKKIEEMDITGNRFAELNCFVALSSSLKILNVSKNALSKIELSAPLYRLEELYASHNSIKRLNGIPARLPNLQVLDLGHNQIHNDRELLCLQDCQVLRELNLIDNPFDLDELGQVATNPAEIISTLHVLDGMVIKKQTPDTKAPLMRPMSASHVISSRQVQTQLLTLDTEMKNLQQSLEDKFREFRAAIDKLPSRPSSSASVSDRPATRGSRRSRIMEAKAFATHRYSNS